MNAIPKKFYVIPLSADYTPCRYWSNFCRSGAPFKRNIFEKHISKNLYAAFGTFWVKKGPLVDPLEDLLESQLFTNLLALIDQKVPKEAYSLGLNIFIWGFSKIFRLTWIAGRQKGVHWYVVNCRCNFRNLGNFARGTDFVLLASFGYDATSVTHENLRLYFQKSWLNHEGTKRSNI